MGQEQCWGAVSLRGGRSRQQDCFSCAAKKNSSGSVEAVVCLADGHGVWGRHYAETAVRSAESVLECGGAEHLHALLGLGRFCRDLTGGAHDGGTTFTCAQLQDGILRVAWLGDSEARLLRRDGHWRTLTIPHVYGIHRAETARLDRRGATIVNGYGISLDELDPRPKTGRLSLNHLTLGITRALGDECFRPDLCHEAESVSANVTPEDAFLVVGSDGFWNCIGRRGSRRKRAAEIILSRTNAEDATAALSDALLAWKPRDNATCVIVDLRPA